VYDRYGEKHFAWLKNKTHIDARSNEANIISPENVTSIKK